MLYCDHSSHDFRAGDIMDDTWYISDEIKFTYMECKVSSGIITHPTYRKAIGKQSICVINPHDYTWKKRMNR